ncbi:MAG: hypothetical protein QOF76_3737 [Solirubrobacteraceae bacterium]|jgi:inosine-uridine nucleoside N-ribohydrolase|nr:hypothetical protein [Solirubrobacteraceae bacterium]
MTFRTATLAVLILGGLGGPAQAAVTLDGSATTVTFPMGSTRAPRLVAPAGARPGDVLVATVTYAAGGQTAKLTPPAGWTLVVRKDRGHDVSLAIFRHTFAAGESTYTFATDRPVGGVGVVAAYSGVDAAQPVDGAAIADSSGKTTVQAPPVTTTVPGDRVLSVFGGLAKGGASITWQAPSGTTEIADAAAGLVSSTLDDVLQDKVGDTGRRTATATAIQQAALAATVALRPAAEVQPPPPPPPPPAGAVPLIVDTDIFSDADDVGTLATAYGLQLRGEAKVIAVGVNTRTSRPAVARDSWRCVAAISAFYGSAGVPIGTRLPNDGTTVNTPDFAGPCGRLADPSTPVPAGAVGVYRRALAAQPDNSVVIASTGYLGNLADLLKSGPDAISPLSGRDLVAQKVRTLVAMGGGYPSRAGENNLIGDPAAAQYVSANWPTRLVWAGYEVGDEIHTGQTISSAHPASSPVRVAYEAFVRPGNWIYSYDLVAVFHAIRPAATSLSVAGPGTNTIDSGGGNVFTPGAGNQYYLRLENASALDDSIEALLDTVPAAPPPAAQGLQDPFDGPGLDAARWDPLASGSTVAVSGGALEISHPGGAWTKAQITSRDPVPLAGGAVSVDVLRAANDGRGGSTYGETSVYLQTDATHYVEFFIGGGSLAAFVNRGGSVTNLTPSWPAYPGARTLRFREAGGTITLESAAPGTTAWTTLASTASPFGSANPVLRIVAGSNIAGSDVARFDNVRSASGARSAALGRSPRRARRLQRRLEARGRLGKRSNRP